MVTLSGLELIYRDVHSNSIEKLGVSQTIMMEITSQLSPTTDRSLSNSKWVKPGIFLTSCVIIGI